MYIDYGPVACVRGMLPNAPARFTCPAAAVSSSIRLAAARRSHVADLLANYDALPAVALDRTRRGRILRERAARATAWD